MSQAYNRMYGYINFIDCINFYVRHCIYVATNSTIRFCVNSFTVGHPWLLVITIIPPARNKVMCFNNNLRVMGCTLKPNLEPTGSDTFDMTF